MLLSQIVFEMPVIERSSVRAANTLRLDALEIWQYLLTRLD